VSESHIGNLETALRAKLENAAAAMAEDPCPATIKAYSSAKKALEFYQSELAQAEEGDRFKNLEQAAAWIIAQGFIVSARTVRNHAEQPGFPRLQKDGTYLQKDIAAYAGATWENPSRPDLKDLDGDDTNEQIKKETLRKLQISNDQKVGSLVPLEEEIRRRVNVIVGMKIAIDNERPFFVSELITHLRSSHQGNPQAAELIGELGEEAGHLFSEIVLRVFDVIGKSGGVKASRPAPATDSDR
jgi:hypothetical protein